MLSFWLIFYLDLKYQLSASVGHLSRCPQIIDTFRQDYFPLKKLKNSFNRRTIKGIFKFLKQKISSVKSVDYLNAPT